MHKKTQIKWLSVLLTLVMAFSLMAVVSWHANALPTGVSGNAPRTDWAGKNYDKVNGYDWGAQWGSITIDSKGGHYGWYDSVEQMNNATQLNISSYNPAEIRYSGTAQHPNVTLDYMYNHHAYFPDPFDYNSDIDLSSSFLFISSATVISNFSGYQAYTSNSSYPEILNNDMVVWDSGSTLASNGRYGYILMIQYTNIIQRSAQVTFYANGGYWQYGSSYTTTNIGTSVNIGNPLSYGHPGIPLRNGYTFLGFSYSSSSGSDLVDLDNYIISWPEYIVLYAQWEPIPYDITYDLDGGTNNSANPLTYTIADATITLQDPIRVGYTFVEWVDKDGNPISEITAGSTGDMELFAQWIEDQYTVIYDPGDHGAWDAVEETYDGLDYGASTPAFGGDIDTDHKHGYTFAGWDKAVAPTVTEDVTYTALWTANTYTVTYNANDGVGGPNDGNTYQAGDTVTVAIGIPTRDDGHTFYGWDYDGNHYSAGGAFTMPAHDVTLIAHWIPEDEATYSVTYAPGEHGTWDAADETTMGLVYGAVTVEFDGDTDTDHHPGYTFTGWDKPIAPTVKEDAIYTALWSAHTYTVTYNANDGTDAPTDTNTHHVGETVNISSVKPTRPGHTFVEWHYSGDAYSAGDTFTMPAHNVTLIAQWSEDHYKVIYDPGTHGSWLAADATYAGLFYKAHTPAFSGDVDTDHDPGYIFTGWDKDIAPTVTGNATYTALWTATVNNNTNGGNGSSSHTVTTPTTTTSGSSDETSAGNETGGNNENNGRNDNNGGNENDNVNDSNTQNITNTSDTQTRQNYSNNTLTSGIPPGAHVGDDGTVYDENETPLGQMVYNEETEEWEFVPLANIPQAGGLPVFWIILACGLLFLTLGAALKPKSSKE